MTPQPWLTYNIAQYVENKRQSNDETWSGDRI